MEDWTHRVKLKVGKYGTGNLKKERFYALNSVRLYIRRGGRGREWYGALYDWGPFAAY
jgi:hypothetical protein